MNSASKSSNPPRFSMRDYALLTFSDLLYQKNKDWAICRDDKVLFWSLLEKGYEGFTVAMIRHLLEQNGDRHLLDLLDKQLKDSRLFHLGILGPRFKPNKGDGRHDETFYNRMRKLKIERKKGFTGTLDVRKFIRPLAEEKLPVSLSERDIYFLCGDRGHQEKMSNICFWLIDLVKRCTADRIIAQRAQKVRRARFLATGSRTEFETDGYEVFTEFRDVISCATLEVEPAFFRQMIEQVKSDPGADFLPFAAIAQLVVGSYRPVDQLAFGPGVIGLLLGRQRTTESWTMRDLGKRSGTRVLGDWFLHLSDRGEAKDSGGDDQKKDQEQGKSATGDEYGRYRGGWSLFFRNKGESAIPLNAGSGANFPARVFLLDRNKITEDQHSFRKSGTAESVFARLTRHPVIKPKRSRKALPKAFDFSGVHKDFLGYKALEILLSRLGKSKKDRLLRSGIDAYHELERDLSRFFEDGILPDEVMKANLLDAGSNDKRVFKKQDGKSEVIDKVLQQPAVHILGRVNEQLGFPIQNFLRGLDVMHPQLVKDFQKAIQKKNYGIFNADVAKCFDSLDFSRPETIQAVHHGLSRIGTYVTETELSILTAITENFVYRVLNGGFASDSISHGRVATGLILLPAVWTVMCFPLVEELCRFRDQGDLSYVSLCGDDFIAVCDPQISSTSKDLIETLFKDFAKKLNVKYHFFKNYKGKVPSDKMFVDRFASHGVDIVHGAMKLDAHGKGNARAKAGDNTDIDKLKARAFRDFSNGNTYLATSTIESLSAEINSLTTLGAAPLRANSLSTKAPSEESVEVSDLHFVHGTFLKMFKQGKTPDFFLNREIQRAEARNATMDFRPLHIAGESLLEQFQRNLPKGDRKILDQILILNLPEEKRIPPHGNAKLSNALRLRGTSRQSQV